MCSRIMYKRVIFLQLHYNTKLRKHEVNAKSMDLVHGTNCSERLSKVSLCSQNDLALCSLFIVSLCL